MNLLNKTTKLLGVIIVLAVIMFTISITFNNKQIPISFFGGQEIFSPSDWVNEEQIKVYSDKIVLNVKNATWASFTDTNSMDPFIDETSNAIEILPARAEAINIGDVISYKTNYGIIIHRVIEKGIDKEGIYYIVKGDNNKLKDPIKVRFEDVKGVVIAVIY
jgi:signal peptidase I